jgi:redox-sensitive bicupin YhaK (pirin superfamily)
MPNLILDAQPLGFQWGTANPFLFCVHHNDAFPAGNGKFGPAASLQGRSLGQDFEGIDGWRMYHGREVPGFPQHPHRGFETVTIVRRGLIDHSDSLGAAARYGNGDVQWLTAGAGIVHAEMFPLLSANEPNPLELFQIWLNLPRASKMVKPYFSMLWEGTIPKVRHVDDAGRATEVTLIAGALAGTPGAAPPPDSWASQPDSDVAIWTIHLQSHATFTLPRARGTGTVRSLYFFAGASLKVAGESVSANTGLVVRADRDIQLQAGEQPVEILLLQGRPIDEPVVQYGPFVMNTREEIVRAFHDYQQTQFGGWPWPSNDPVHGPEPRRFAKHPDGRLEQRDGAVQAPAAPLEDHVRSSGVIFSEVTPVAQPVETGTESGANG